MPDSEFSALWEPGAPSDPVVDALHEIKYQAEAMEGTMQSIERLLRDSADAQQEQFRKLKADVENIKSMTNWIAGIALMFGISFIVKSCS